MNDRIVRLRTVAATVNKKQNDSDSNDEVTRSQDSNGSPRSTNASRVEHQSFKSSQADFYRSETSFKNVAQKSSLADSLRQRREFNDLLVKEREALGSSKLIPSKSNAVVKETDITGSAIRIRQQQTRPETPKLNLLQIQQRQKIALQKIPVQDKKPFNYLNPYQNIATLSTREINQPNNSTSKEEVKRQERRESDQVIEQVGVINMQDQLLDILEQDEVGDVMELNEKFLTMALGGVEVHELATIKKIELRVDTSCHNLQVTGEILSNLKQLKLNDSVIKCFRDIGTSFKNVQVLHVARCELLEVQGIMALESLQELYISFNGITDLFDISFLNNLKVLDLEGNDVKDLDQLYYLRRLQNIVDLNLKHNPVSKQGDYLKLIGEVCPNLYILDDNSNQIEQSQKTKRILSDQTSFQRFKSLGIPQLEELCSQAYEQVVQEPNDWELLTTTIKNKNRDQKAKQSYDQNVRYFDRQQLLFETESDMFASRTSFFKSDSRFTQSNFFDDGSSSASDMMSNTNQAYVGGSMSILRNKVSKIKQSTSTALSNDILTLLSENYQDAESQQQDIRSEKNLLKVKAIRLSSARKQRPDSAQRSETKEEVKILKLEQDMVRQQMTQVKDQIKVANAPKKIKILGKDSASKTVFKASQIMFNRTEEKQS